MFAVEVWRKNRGTSTNSHQSTQKVRSKNFALTLVEEDYSPPHPDELEKKYEELNVRVKNNHEYYVTKEKHEAAGNTYMVVSKSPHQKGSPHLEPFKQHSQRHSQVPGEEQKDEEILGEKEKRRIKMRESLQSPASQVDGKTFVSDVLMKRHLDLFAGKGDKKFQGLPENDAEFCPYDVRKVYREFDEDLSEIVPLLSSIRRDKFLINCSPFGPNNQLRGFRDTILMAIYLNRTIVLPPFFKHNSDPSSTRADYLWFIF